MFMMKNTNLINFEQMLYTTEEKCLEMAIEVLEQSSKAKTLSKKIF